MRRQPPEINVGIYISSRKLSLIKINDLMQEPGQSGRDRDNPSPYHVEDPPRTVWCWVCSSYVSEDYDINIDSGLTICSLLLPVAQRFVDRVIHARIEIDPDIEVELVANVFSGEYAPVIDLSPQLIRIAASMEAKIIIDFLTWPSSSSHDS